MGSSTVLKQGLHGFGSNQNFGQIYSCFYCHLPWWRGDMCCLLLCCGPRILRLERRRTEGVNESLPWLPKEIKHRQLPGKSNKVSHFVFHNALWQVTSAEDKDMKQKHRDWETVCVCVGGVGVRVDGCQRLNPECGKGRGIGWSLPQLCLIYWFKTHSRKLRQAWRKGMFIRNPLEGICFLSGCCNPYIIGRSVLSEG